MFGVQRLKEEIEGLREEKEYFRSKFLEQVSEITALKDALARSEKEVGRLRRELMGQSPLSSSSPSLSMLSPHHRKSPVRNGRVATGTGTGTANTHHRDRDRDRDDIHNHHHRPQQDEKKEDHNCTNNDEAQDDHRVSQHIVGMEPIVMSSLSAEEDQDQEDFSSDEEDEDEDEDEQVAIRQKAEQLVRWASYRQEVLLTSSHRCSITKEASDDESEETEEKQ